MNRTEPVQLTQKKKKTVNFSSNPRDQIKPSRPPPPSFLSIFVREDEGFSDNVILPWMKPK
jgi:hypothetical protein